MSPGSTMLADALPAPANRLSTLPPWPWDPFDTSAPMTLGWSAARWAESILIQPNGPRAGQPFRFTGDQMRFLLWWYALDDDARWIYYHGVRRLAKGSGKSPFAAVLALIEFCGPVRIDRKDDRLPGGCAGRPVDMPLVQIAATAESQTANTMRMVRAFAPKGSPVVTEYSLDPGKTRYYKLPEGTLEIITSSVTASEGAESSFIIADETEHSKPSNGGPELVATLEDNLAKSGSRLLETANAWVPGIETVAESSWDAWVAQEEGRLLDGAGRILYDARLAPPDVDLADYDSLKAALQHVYGDCEWKFGPDGLPDVEAIIARIWSPKSKPSESKRKYLNWPTVHENAWCAPKDWERLAEPRDVTPTEPVVMFFDGSKSRDATAVVACCLSDGYVFVPKTIDGRPTIWEPDPSHDTDDVVPVHDIDTAVKHIATTAYNVVGFFGDVQEWESFVKIEWPQAFGDRLQVMAVPGGKDPQRIAWDMRSNTFDFTRAAELCEAEITEGGFHHDGNPVLARHVANCRRYPNRYGVSVSKESRSSPLKIDAGVCMIGARMVRRLVLAAGVKKPRSGVVQGIR
jgi:hypothetical protein